MSFYDQIKVHELFNSPSYYDFKTLMKIFSFIKGEVLFSYQSIAQSYGNKAPILTNNRSLVKAVIHQELRVRDITRGPLSVSLTGMDAVFM